MKYREVKELLEKFEVARYPDTWILRPPQFEPAIQQLKLFLQDRDLELELNSDALSELIAIIRVIKASFADENSLERQLARALRDRLAQQGVVILDVELPRVTLNISDPGLPVGPLNLADVVASNTAPLLSTVVLESQPSISSGFMVVCGAAGSQGTVQQLNNTAIAFGGVPPLAAAVAASLLDNSSVRSS